MATQPTSKPLTTAQREHFARLVNQLTAAEHELATAQRLRDAAQAAANGFIVYCSTELGVPLGVDGWNFDQPQMRFVQRLDSTEDKDE